jgi:hypothetical protein
VQLKLSNVCTHFEEQSVCRVLRLAFLEMKPVQESVYFAQDLYGAFNVHGPAFQLERRTSSAEAHLRAAP